VAVGGTISSEPGSRIAGEAASNPYVHLPGQRSIGLRGLAAFAGFHLLLAIAFYAILRARRTEAMAALVASRPWRTLLLGSVVGTVGGLLFPAVERMGRFADMGVTLLTVALGGIAAAGFVGLCCLVGRRLVGRGGLHAVAGGAVALTALQLVPVAGFLASIGIVALALGAAVGAPFGDRSTAGRPRVPVSSPPRGKRHAMMAVTRRSPWSSHDSSSLASPWP
jgi:hypothetical protein